jgi:hypothetical protein
MRPDALHRLLADVASGALSPNEAAERLVGFPFALGAAAAAVRILRRGWGSE